VSDPKKKPGALWMLFYGRRRRGFPWLLVGILVAALAFGLLFALPGGADFSRGAAAALFGLVLAAAIVLAVVAVLRPRRRP
jgi:uncharacterized membrane protein YccC